MTAVALACVYPVFAELDEALGRQPGAGYLLDQALDADFARLHPEVTVALGGGSLVVLLVFVFLSGGILSNVGTGRPFTYSSFLADGGRLFFRNLRVLLIGAVVAMALSFGVHHLDRLIRHEWLYESSAGPLDVFIWETRWLSLELLLDLLSWLWGVLFLVVLFVSKMAMARLAAYDRRSATWAWLRAAGTAARHPVRTALVVIGWAVVGVVTATGVGWLTTHFLESQMDIAAGLAVGQVGVMWTQVMLVGFLVAARGVAVPKLPAPPPEEDRAESIFALLEESDT